MLHFICAYLGYDVPVILLGFLSEQFGVVHTLIGFGAVLLISNVFLIVVYQKTRDAIALGGANSR